MFNPGFHVDSYFDLSVPYASPTEQPATLPELGRDRKLASVQAQRAMEAG